MNSLLFSNKYMAYGECTAPCCEMIVLVLRRFCCDINPLLNAKLEFIAEPKDEHAGSIIFCKNDDRTKGTGNPKAQSAAI